MQTSKRVCLRSNQWLLHSENRLVQRFPPASLARRLWRPREEVRSGLTTADSGTPHSMNSKPTFSSPLQTYLEGLHAQHLPLRDGAVATYIPELAKADPDWFGICLVTTGGHVYEVGSTRQSFTIQSISKPFVYGLALEDNTMVWPSRTTPGLRCSRRWGSNRRGMPSTRSASRPGRAAPRIR